MTLTDNNAVQLWRKAEADARDVVNLMLSASENENEREHAFKILKKLRSATAAIQELERRMAGVVAPK